MKDEQIGQMEGQTSTKQLEAKAQESAEYIHCQFRLQ